MKTNIKQSCRILLLGYVLLTACQKETSVKNTSTENKATANSSDEASAKFCRLHSWQGLDDGYLRTLHYNSKGLMDNWHETAPLYGEDLTFTIQYDHFNQVSKMTYSDHGSLLYTVFPVYKWNRITKELWYVGDSKTVDDTVINTYNRRGLIVKRESINYYVYATFEYDILGNNTVNVTKDAITGAVYDSTIQAFKKPVIEPMKAAPGMPYAIWALSYVICPLKYTGFTEYDPDENGNLIKTYELDQSKSILKANSFHFAAYHDTYDDVSMLENRQVWHYENCNCDNIDDAISNSFVSPVNHNKEIPFSYSSIPQIRERILQMRKRKK